MKYTYEQIYQTQSDRIRYEQLTKALTDLGYGPAQIRYFTAPGRSELGGNHTDHQNGRVLAAAVDVDTAAAVAENGTDRIRFHSKGFAPCALSVDPEQNREIPPQSAGSLVAGMIAAFAPRCRLRGLDIFADSTVLPGGGLSSSASVEVLLAEIFNEIFETGLAPLELAKLGQWVENVYFGKPCGLLDQAASAMGGVTYMDFRDPAEPRAEKLELEPERFGYALYIVNCGADHADLTDEYAAIPGELKALCGQFGKGALSEVEEAAFYERLPALRKTCSDRAILRAIHVYDENRRVLAMREALRQEDFAAYLSLVRESGLSSWRYLQNIYPTGSTSQPMALTLAICEKLLEGAGACRVHGGGFAGTIQAYVPLKRAESFRTRMETLLPACSCQRRRIRPVGAAELELG